MRSPSVFAILNHRLNSLSNCCFVKQKICEVLVYYMNTVNIGAWITDVIVKELAYVKFVHIHI
jgi:hypothetical protein